MLYLFAGYRHVSLLVAAIPHTSRRQRPKHQLPYILSHNRPSGPGKTTFRLVKSYIKVAVPLPVASVCQIPKTKHKAWSEDCFFNIYKARSTKHITR